MLTTSDLNHIQELIVQQFNPKQIILFGSYARGSMSEASDLDLIVIDEKADSKEEDFTFKISRSLFPRNYHLDLLTYTPEEFISKLNSKRSFSSAYKKKGKPSMSENEIKDWLEIIQSIIKKKKKYD